MASSAEALSNLGRRFVFRNSEQAYVRRVTMSSRDAIPRDSTGKAEFASHWLRDSAARLVEFTRLPHDWDLEGGEPVDPFAARAAFLILRDLSKTIAIAPDLVPVGDGGVMVQWHTPTVDLEIEVGSDLEGSVFLRDRVHNRQVHSARLRPLLASLSRLGAWIDPQD